MCAKIIDARVKQKTDTLANWNANPMKLLDGEPAFVITGEGQPLQIRLGWGGKRFSELPNWIDFNNAQRVSAQPPGALTDGPAGETKYMEATAVGTYTYGGNTLATITEDGYKATFWWTGTEWISNGVVRVKGDVSTGTDTLQSELVPKGKAVESYVKSKSADLFSYDDVNLFENSNLLVRRYTGASTFNDYTAGYSQSAVSNGLRVEIPASGSTATKHYLRTGIDVSNLNIEVPFVDLGNPDGQPFLLSIGWIDGAGVYKSYAYSTSGNFNYLNNYTSTQLQIGLETYSASDNILFKITGRNLYIYKNSTLIKLHPLNEDEFKGELIIGQGGFPFYTTSLSIAVSAIKDYVDESLAGFIDEESLYSKADELFEVKDTSSISPNMIVRRVLTTGAETNYSAGTYQTVSGGYININIPASGSTGTRHYFFTSKPIDFNYLNNFKYVVRNNPTAGSWGIAVYDGTYYQRYDISYNGVIRKSIDNVVTILDDSIQNVVQNDLITVSIQGSTIYFYINDVLKFSCPIEVDIFNENILLSLGGFNPTDFIFEKTDTTFKNKIIELISENGASYKKGYYSYNSTVKEFLLYSLIKENKYACYRVKNEVDMREQVYVDYWRIINCQVAMFDNGQMSLTGEYLIVDGESEFVFKQNASKDDFTGGAHGDELKIREKFFADGIEIDYSSDIPLTPCNKFEYSVYSSMHETMQGGVVVPTHPIIAFHDKHTVFENGGYETYNKVTWNYNGLLTLLYSLSCVGKSAATRATFNEYKTTDFEDTSINTGLSSEQVGKSVINFYGDAYSCTVWSKVIASNVDNSTCILFYNSRNLDTKYYRQTPPKTVSIGEVWETVMKVRFS